MEKLLFSIRKNGEVLGWIYEINEYESISYRTEGSIGEGNEYNNIVELIMGLQGFDIEIDNFYT